MLFISKKLTQQLINLIYKFIFTIIHSIKFLQKEKQRKNRCGHHSSSNEQYVQNMTDHANAMRTVVKNIDFDSIIKRNITLNIPMVFHICDPDLVKTDWTQHINNNIIRILNDDYNRKYSNYKDVYTGFISKIFANADPNMKTLYMNTVNILSKLDNVQWNFTLDSIVNEIFTVTDPSTGRQTTPGIGDTNEEIFRKIKLNDPERKLNIIICKSYSGILGISVFPFSDRSPMNESCINPSLAYRNGILIASDMFTGNSTEYNLYRTFTHEIGHWHGLLHPFDNISLKTNDIRKYGLHSIILEENAVINGVDQNASGDLIADTFPQEGETYGTVEDRIEERRVSIINNLTRKTHVGRYASIFDDRCGRQCNFFNFMDYTDDCQLVMFTHDQILKMVYMMVRFRPNFVIIS